MFVDRMDWQVDQECKAYRQWRAERRAKAAERHRLAVLVCVCAVALALTVLWHLGPLPEGLL